MKENVEKKEKGWFGASNWKQKTIWVIAIIVYAALYKPFISQFDKIVSVFLAAAFGGIAGLLTAVFRDKTNQQKDGIVMVTGDKCKGCDRRIHESEKAVVVNGELFCIECERNLRK